MEHIKIFDKVYFEFLQPNNSCEFSNTESIQL